MASLYPFFETHRLLLAPMAGVSDAVFRRLAREQGASLAYTEMVSAKGLSYANEKTRHLVDLDPDEELVAVQIFGHEPAIMAREAAWIEDELEGRLAYIDVNMGCPVRKLVRKGDGAALMEAPEVASRIVASVAGAIEHPVTVKMRRGFAEGDETCVDLARRMEDAGAAAVTVHGRFAAQLYRGRADWGCIARVKRAVTIPVVGNGDVACGDDALSLIRQTSCDAVMIARAAEGNPWVFADCRARLAGSCAPAAPTPRERIEMARRHARLLSAREGKQLVRMRKHAMWYVAGLPGASVARARFNDATALGDFERIFDELLARLEG